MPPAARVSVVALHYVIVFELEALAKQTIGCLALQPTTFHQPLGLLPFFLHLHQRYKMHNLASYINYSSSLIVILLKSCQMP